MGKRPRKESIDVCLDSLEEALKDTNVDSAGRSATIVAVCGRLAVRDVDWELTLFCLKAFKKLTAGQSTLKYVAVHLAVLLMGNHRSGKESAQWAHDQINDACRGERVELPGQVLRLVLVAHGLEQARTDDERLMSQIELAGRARKASIEYAARHARTQK